MATVTSREFNQHTSRAKRAAEHGPVVITDRGRPSHVLLSYRQYQSLSAPMPTLAELLGTHPDAGRIDFDLPVFDEAGVAADLA